MRRNDSMNAPPAERSLQEGYDPDLERDVSVRDYLPGSSPSDRPQPGRGGRRCEHGAGDEVGDACRIPAQATQVEHLARVAGDVPHEQHHRRVTAQPLQQRLDLSTREGDHRLTFVATLQETLWRPQMHCEFTVLLTRLHPRQIPGCECLDGLELRARRIGEQLDGTNRQLQDERSNRIVDRREVPVRRCSRHPSELCDVREPLRGVRRARPPSDSALRVVVRWFVSCPNEPTTTSRRGRSIRRTSSSRTATLAFVEMRLYSHLR